MCDGTTLYVVQSLSAHHTLWESGPASRLVSLCHPHGSIRDDFCETWYLRHGATSPV
jgi:hypothetical protein